MDAVTDPSIERIVFMKASQVGFTEALMNILGYYIDHDPSPILVVLPTLDIAGAVSKDRIAPMLRDTPCLRGRVQDARTRDSGNTVFHKTFPGGHITLSGANSPASLASRPVRVVLCDEIDRFPPSAGSEGNPMKLAFKRATTFWNRKLIVGSTPTIKGQSEIERAYEHSDQRKFWVPCPLCSTYQLFQWAQVRWEVPEEAKYHCVSCKSILDHKDKLWMIAHGEWRAEQAFKGIAGFWLSELYSPWVTFSQTVQNFLEAKKKGKKDLQVWVNTALGEVWEETDEGEKLDEASLSSRKEAYGPQIPMNAALLTAAADIQQDRIEAELKAWGKGEESWGIEHKIFHGDTTNPESGAWKDLGDWLDGSWTHESGVKLHIACALIDSGFRTKEAYAFIKPRQSRRVFAIKGSKDRGRPIIGRPSINNLAKIKLFQIGTETAKATLYSRLQKSEPGPGYLHFPMTYDSEYFLQLTAEKKVTTYRKGWAITEWIKLRANEALDLNCYNLAAVTLLNANLDRLVDELARKAESADVVADPTNEPSEPRHPVSPRRRNFIKGWR